MSEPLKFPMTDLAFAHVQREWDEAAMRTIHAYGGWVFTKAQMPLPLWLVEAWDNWLAGRVAHGLEQNARAVSWSGLWSSFVGSMLAYCPEWQRAVEIATREDTA